MTALPTESLQVAFTEVLYDAHLAAASEEFNSLGLTLGEADMFRAIQTVQQHASEKRRGARRRDFLHLILDAGRRLNTLPVKSSFPIDLEGATNAILISSRVPAFSEPELHDRETRIFVYTDPAVAEGVKAARTHHVPYKYTRGRFRQLLGNDSRYLSVFTAPDLKPTAIHEEDARYVRRQYGRLLPPEAVVETTRESFGEDALIHLSENACAAIISAVQTSRHEILHEP